MRNVKVPEDTRGIGTPEREIKDEEGRVVGKFDDVDILRLRLGRYVAQNAPEDHENVDLELFKAIVGAPPVSASAEKKPFDTQRVADTYRAMAEASSRHAPARQMHLMYQLSKAESERCICHDQSTDAICEELAKIVCDEMKSVYEVLQAFYGEEGHESNL
jgi:hypothetical protein